MPQVRYLYCAIIIIIIVVVVVVIIIIITIYPTNTYLLKANNIYLTNNYLLKVNNRNFRTIEALKNGVKYFKVNKKRHQNNIFIYAYDIVLMSLLLTLNIFHTLF